ncbi:MAG: DPP IV N-terminal domain-containing protein, partial [Chloroflexota bacterium]|nr:DPP IV N-terminal domain-containing protein [Chloroflexota bacterium]
SPTPTPVGSGGTVAFAMRHNGNSDLYLLPQDDGQLLRLTYNPAEDRDPAWSPDGRWLAFASNRTHNWDLYLMDMHSGTVLRLTRDPTVEAGPAWSPDSQWLAYESYAEGNLNIHIINVDGEQTYQLTHDPAPDFSPAWSPDGRHITFTSLREGNRDIHLISLDGGTLVNLTNTPEQNEDNASWSHTGTHLAYSSGSPGNEEIHVLPFDQQALASGDQQALTSGALRPLLFGIGGEPTWSPDDEALTYIFRQGANSYLVAASSKGWALAQEGYSTTDWMESPSWTAHTIPAELSQQLEARMTQEDSPLYTELLMGSSAHAGKATLVGLPDVNGGDNREKLSDNVNDSFNALRRSILDKTGWDYFTILGDSYRPMQHTPRPGQGRISWHVCGRAVDINQGFLRDDRIELVREDIGGVTYWRVYIQAKVQDGTLGEPLRAIPWDLAARAKGGLAAMQGGELKPEAPAGYYVDFTTLAADYGWERRNALSGWRSSWFDIEWWHFQKTEGMSWYDCMLEMYDADEIAESYGNLPWWTKRPEWEVAAYPW